MPKVNDSQCPLGFHPQFRRPNYCKRCFREYSEHKSAKEGSTTSINSLSIERSSRGGLDRKDDPYGSRDSLVSTFRYKDELESCSQSRSDLTSTGNDEDKGSWSKGKSLSWSAQDLRKAVDDAKLQVKAPTKQEISRYYGSTRSLTQDLGSLSSLLNAVDSTTSLSKDVDQESSRSATTTSSSSTAVPKSSFSSYLAMRTKSPARPPGSKATPLQTSTSPSPLLYSKLDDITEKDVPPTSILRTKSPKTESSPLKVGIDGRPPKGPSRILKDRPTTLPELREQQPSAYSQDSSNVDRKKIIQSLRKTIPDTEQEVKSEDDADASYVIQIRPKKKVKDTSPTTPVKRVEIDFQPEVERLKKEIKDLNKENNEINEKYQELQLENKELSTKKSRFGDIRKATDNTKLQNKVDDLNEDIKKKIKEMKDIKKELEKRPLSKDIERTLDDLRYKLQAAEQLCEELMDENEDFKKEVTTLEDEIEEMQDNFREEQADEYRDLKRELEQRAKDCRVLQFKLKKAERRSDQMERDRSEYEDKLKELQVGEGDIERSERVKSMEKELNLAKEVSMKMHEEMEKMLKQLEVAEIDKNKLKEKVQDTPIKPGIKVSRSQMMGRQGSQDNSDQLLRDLQDCLEREHDIKEQLRYSEEETKNFRKKLSRVEEENETLQLQLSKMSTKAKQNRQRSLERTGSLERSGSVERGTLSRQGSTENPIRIHNGEDLDPTDLKIQMELNEQESNVLRRKVEGLESENLRLQKELKEFLSTPDSKKSDYGTTPEISKDNIYFTKKLKMFEHEVKDLRKKLIESEKDRDQLKSDLDISKKRAKITRSRSQEYADSEDKKHHEQLEKETNSLKLKIQEIESHNENLSDENKRLTVKNNTRLPTTTQENMYIEKQVLEDKIKRLERKLKEALEKLKNSPSTTVIKEIGSESKELRISELQIQVQKLMTECSGLTNEIEEMKQGSGYNDRKKKEPKDTTPKSTLFKWVNELESECAHLHSALKEADENRGSSRSENSSSLRDFQDKLEKEREINKELTCQLKEERKKLDSKVNLKKRNGFGSRDDDCKRYEDQIESLKGLLKEENDKFQEYKIKITDENKTQIDQLRSAQTQKHELLKEEYQLLSEKRRIEDTEGKMSLDKDELKRIQKGNDRLKMEVEDMKDTIIKFEKEKRKLNLKYDKDMDQVTKEKEDMDLRMTALDAELKTERKKRERIDRDNTVNLKGKTSEISDYKDKVDRIEAERATEQRESKFSKNEYENKIKYLEKKCNREKKDLESLQSKFDLLEEDYVIQKAQITTGVARLESPSIKKEFDTVQKELRTLRETYNNHQDKWIKQKLDLEMKLKETEAKNGDGGSYSEKKKLKKIIDDKNHEVESQKAEADLLKDQLSSYRREAEELRRQAEDLEKLQEMTAKHQAMTALDPSSYETTISELKTKLTAMDKMTRSDQTKMKMRYDAKLKSVNEEMSTVSHHMSKYRRERDTYKEMLDGAQRAIADLKGGSSTSYRTSRADNATEAKAHLTEIHDLQGLLTEVEDKLADSRLDSTKMKTCLVDQKSNYEIQLSELNTKLNEYEEDRLLTGGGRRLPGLRTRLELNWQKEREEQQRLLKETATLAKDLRQTLYEVERERDMERLEGRRKIDQLKRTVNQDHHDTKSKVQELQRDLIELRDAHAKLRQINEKLRREKDRTEVEREAMRDKFLGSSRETLNQQTKIERLLDEFKKIKDLSPLIFDELIDGKDSSSTSLATDAKPIMRTDFVEALRKMVRTSDDLRCMMHLDDPMKMRRTPSFRRALSAAAESDDDSSSLRSHSTGRRGPGRHMGHGPRAQLFRKAQSLDHQLADDRGKIWVSTDAGSTSSIESSRTDDARRSALDYDRMSTGSQTSDLDVVEKKKGIKGMFNKLSKAKSIEDTNIGGFIMGAGLKAMVPSMSGSGSSIASEADKDASVKGRIKGLFNKKPSLLRTQSFEKDTPNVKKISSKFESSSETANLPMNSVVTDEESIPPVMRRLGKASAYGLIGKRSFARSHSSETEV